MKQQIILKINVKTSNNTIYTEAIAYQIKEQIEKQNLGTFIQDDIFTKAEPIKTTIDLKDVAFKMTNPTIKEDKLLVDIKILKDLPNGKILNDIIDIVVFRPRGIGNVDENGIITDYKLICINAINKDSDTFK